MGGSRQCLQLRRGRAVPLAVTVDVGNPDSYQVASASPARRAGWASCQQCRHRAAGRLEDTSDAE